MMKAFSTLVICAVLVASEAVKLPSYFSQCKRDDANLNDCIKNSGNNGIETFLKGDSGVHVVPMTPLHVNEMFIDVDGNLKINLTNADIVGLDTGKIDRVNWDWENKKLHVDVRLQNAGLVGNYDINGRILILPITGQGPCNITYVNGLFKFEFDYEIEERNSKEYINIVKGGMTYTVDRAYFVLLNLFGGDKRLGEEMSKFLDENWKEVNGEIGARVGDALAQVFTTVIKSFFSRVSLKNLFG